MDNLLSWYEHELSKLRRASQSFAQQHPEVAGRLQLSGEASTDPEVERLLQSIALLNARTAARIGDQHAGLASAMLAEHPSQRPFPSCAIAQIDYGNAKPNTISSTVRIPRGTMFKSFGTPACKFRTAYDVHIAPLSITDARIAAIDVPAVLRLPANAATSLRITIESTSASKPLSSDVPLRVHISGPPSQTAAIMDAILMQTLCVCIQAGDQWTLLPRSPFRQAGFEEHDSLLLSTSSHHLLAEYFCFPEKFNFIDIDLPAIDELAQRTSRLVLHLILPEASATLRAVSRANLRLGCTPIINLYSHRAAPIKLDPAQTEYPLAPDRLPESACEIYSIDNVNLLRRSSIDEPPIEFTPFEIPTLSGMHWQASREDQTLTLVDRSRTPLRLASGTLAVHLTCTNRDLPQTLSCGAKGGDLTTEINTAGLPIHLLDKPTPTQQIAAAHAHWPLISILAGIHTLRDLIELLRLHALPTSAGTQHLLQGLLALTSHPASTWLNEHYVQGTEYHLTIRESAFADRSIHVFAQLLNLCLRQHARQGHYSQLIVRSAYSELLCCEPVMGEQSLI